MQKNNKLRLCFAASSGGHFEQLLMLKPLMLKYFSCILTEKTNYKVDVDGVQKLFYLLQVNRKELLWPVKILYNAILSFVYFVKFKPDVIICTGVLSMIPMCLIMKLFRKKIIYIESFAKVTSPTVSGKLLYKYADEFYVQWESMKAFFPRAKCLGGLY